ncbi:DUF6263 family protein [Flavobacterium pallidum]|uniref:DUF4412 domain-containing protein n=1 Tax=Flavobacterium pallidum TaxID=2172098 RepID=A0A2S1SFH8_9FLAO|nr:DUF6263 family protein [Flavobacterium pallidum]AWI25166.1 hypothetical protein HYN49_04230 [Flavobacterium pallidum]
MKKALSIVVLFIGICSMSAQKTALKLNLAKGETYYQNMNVDAVIEQSFEGQNMTMNMKADMQLSYKVTAFENAVFTLEARYRKMTLSMSMPQGNMSFDSDKKDEKDVFSTVLGAIIDKPFIMKITTAGKITEVSGTETVFTAAINELSTLDTAQKGQIMAQLEQSYGKESITKNMDTSFAIYPSKPVSKGEKWTINTVLEAGTDANIETVYELTDITPDYYILKGTAKITPGAGKDTQEVQMTNVNGTMTSDLKLNKKTGWVSASKIIQDIKGIVKTDGEELPVSMKNILTLSDH